nr:MAG TPA: replisome organizer [Caudoviricetes sp.]
MNKQEILKAVAPLQLAFKGNLDDARMRLYVEMLSDIPPQILEAAVKKLIMTNKFLPSIAEIRETAYGIKGTISGTAAPDESEAWGEVVKAIQSVGYYRKPKFSHEAITTAVNNIGWQDICMTTNDGMNTLRAQFRRAYQLAAQRQKDNRDNAVLGISPSNEKLKQLTGKLVKRLS